MGRFSREGVHKAMLMCFTPAGCGDCLQLRPPLTCLGKLCSGARRRGAAPCMPSPAAPTDSSAPRGHFAASPPPVGSISSDPPEGEPGGAQRPAGERPHDVTLEDGKKRTSHLVLVKCCSFV